MITAKEARAVARRMIRENKRLLLGSYLSFLGLSLVVVLAQLLFWQNTLATAFWGFASLFLLVPLTMGILHIHNMIFYRRSCSVGNLFDFYRNYSISLKVLGVSYLFSLILSAVLMPVLTISILPLALGAPLFGGSSAAVAIIGLMGVMLLLIAITLLAESFVMANYFIALRNRSIRFGQLLGSALKIGGRCALRYFLLQLSFFGWGALCCLPLFLSTAVSTYFFDIAGEPLLHPALPLSIAAILLFLLAISALTVYINAASTVFFNVAIDEYEQQYPDFFNIPAPPVSSAPPASPRDRGPVDRYAGPARWDTQKNGPSIPLPPETPAPEKPASGEEEPTPQEDPAPEKVEAEIIEPPQDGLCDVILISPGVGRMLVSMIICELTGMEHEQARQLVESAPKAICMNIPREEAHEIAKRLTEAGAQVELR